MLLLSELRASTVFDVGDINYFIDDQGNKTRWEIEKLPENDVRVCSRLIIKLRGFEVDFSH